MYLCQFWNLYLYIQFKYTSANYYLYYKLINTGSRIIQQIQQIYHAILKRKNSNVGLIESFD